MEQNQKSQKNRIVVGPFSGELYSKTNGPDVRIETKDGRKVVIVDWDFKYTSSSLTEDLTNRFYLAKIYQENGLTVPVILNHQGTAVDLNCKEEDSAVIVKYERPNYDYITIRDVNSDDHKNEGITFSMSPVEYLRYKAFCKDHRSCVSNTGAIGGGIRVSFMPTGLGSLVNCHCEICKTSVDITDTDCW